VVPLLIMAPTVIFTLPAAEATAASVMPPVVVSELV
jgi:hypothetical protein